MNKQGSIFSSLGGHLVDLYRLARFDVRNPYSLSKFRQIRALGKRSGAKTLVETGTYLGNTAMRASYVFDKVITVELSPDLYRQASSYLIKRKNVECIEGDATKVLPEVMARPGLENVLVFLDGHFSGGDTALGDMQEPACLEIEMLGKHRDKLAAIVVDDFRLFGVDGWPRKSELIRSVEDHLGADFDLTVHMDQLLIWRKLAPLRTAVPNS
jgi:hypothetical protein